MIVLNILSCVLHNQMSVHRFSLRLTFLTIFFCCCCLVAQCSISWNMFVHHVVVVYTGFYPEGRPKRLLLRSPGKMLINWTRISFSPAENHFSRSISYGPNRNDRFLYIDSLFHWHNIHFWLTIILLVLVVLHRTTPSDHPKIVRVSWNFPNTNRWKKTVIVDTPKWYYEWDFI